MAGTIDARLRELGITLPDAPAPVANYVPAVRTGNLLFISGQVAMVNGKPEAGRLGENMEVEAGAVAARASGLSIIAQLAKALDGVGAARARGEHEGRGAGLVDGLDDDSRHRQQRAEVVDVRLARAPVQARVALLVGRVGGGSNCAMLPVQREGDALACFTARDLKVGGGGGSSAHSRPLSPPPVSPSHVR
ncbi:MAG: RidA family protein, partial [Pseudomonadota bacterium]|nr:RidA family protein [Pseudomonadota bacterium]